MNICIDRDDLIQFSEVSRDANPLHLSEAYARRTAFGEPVVFGILGAIAALARVAVPHDKRVAGLAIEFHGPLFTDVRYHVRCNSGVAHRVRVEVTDGERPVLSLTLRFVPGQRPQQRLGEEIDRPAAEEPETLLPGEIRVGREVSGIYAARRGVLLEFMERWHLGNGVLTLSQLQALLWASYLVGMKLPGTRATFWKLDMDFVAPEPLEVAPLDFRASVRRFDPRLQLMDAAAELSQASRAFASARVQAFVRQDPLEPSADELRLLLGPEQRLAGKTALVIGGSRGLGASLVQALALQGARVWLNYSRSADAAQQVQAALGDKARLVQLAQGDASDPSYCSRLGDEILARHGSLDILVCNASPPIRPLALSLDSMARMQAFITESLALVTTPLSVFLTPLSARSGQVVLISSAYVTDAPPDWPHYVAAKCAGEGLTRAMARQHPGVRFLIVRPPRLITDQTNTPTGRIGALPCETVAASMADRLGAECWEQNVQIADSFPTAADRPACAM